MHAECIMHHTWCSMHNACGTHDATCTMYAWCTVHDAPCITSNHQMTVFNCWTSFVNVWIMVCSGSLLIWTIEAWHWIYRYEYLFIRIRHSISESRFPFIRTHTPPYIPDTYQIQTLYSQPLTTHWQPSHFGTHTQTLFQNKGSFPFDEFGLWATRCTDSCQTILLLMILIPISILTWIWILISHHATPCRGHHRWGRGEGVGWGGVIPIFILMLIFPIDTHNV